jgi:hypothetical protein
MRVASSGSRAASVGEYAAVHHPLNLALKKLLSA